MTDDCGYPKERDGEPCELPGSKSDGRCHHHTDVDGERANGGRPSILDEYYDDVLEAAKRGLTYEGIARVAGIGRSTLQEWRDKYDEFNRELEQARAIGEQRIIRQVEEQRPEFILERSYGYTKKEEVEHTGDGLDLTLSSDEKDQLNDLFDREPQNQSDEDE